MPLGGNEQAEGGALRFLRVGGGQARKGQNRTKRIPSVIQKGGEGGIIDQGYSWGRKIHSGSRLTNEEFFATGASSKKKTTTRGIDKFGKNPGRGKKKTWKVSKITEVKETPQPLVKRTDR